MSYGRRRIELRKCDLCEEDTVHCETASGDMRCEICGRKEDATFQGMMWNI